MRLWDPATGSPVGDPLTGHTGGVNAVCPRPQPDGSAWLASAGDDGTVRVWDPATGGQVGFALDVPGPGVGLCAVSCAAGQLVVLAGQGLLAVLAPRWWGRVVDVMGGSQMAIVVGVHGISQQQRGGHELARVWRDSLTDGVERATGHRAEVPEVRVAFYGDLFLPEEQVPGTKEAAAVDLLDGLGDEEVAELLSVVEDLPEGVLAGGEGPDKALAPTRLPAPLRALVRGLDARFGASAGVLLLGELRQVRRYLAEPPVTEQADARVSQEVSGQTRVLIGHSLGSVVAFEWARKNPEVPLDLLITLGSPLGLRLIRSRLDAAAAGTAAEVLPHVARWVNVYDPGDVVACACPLGPYWQGVLDEQVNNGDAPHAISRYLNKRQTGAPVADVLGLG